MGATISPTVRAALASAEIDDNRLRLAVFAGDPRAVLATVLDNGLVPIDPKKAEGCRFHAKARGAGGLR